MTNTPSLLSRLSSPISVALYRAKAHWPNILILLAPVLALWFWPDLRTELAKKFGDAEWWAENLIQFVIFTQVVSLLVSYGQKQKERQNREPFENWTIQLTGIAGVNTNPQRIHWSEASRFEDSDFEYWKFIKSSVSNTCLIKTIDAKAAREAGWLKDEGAAIVIDFAAMKEADVIRWQTTQLPDTWEWVSPPAPNSARRKTG